ncbi:PAS/PAC sensor hybrid histidine kinase [Dyella jiangningensis]|uniref:hybrid sensor histidine kinase/response regulator n=1 Tax=Dyella sp. AtDHG13 TaxID=1938897 RepID=UPI00087EB75A|nr:PAS domain-containing sensor histidine kinase [Dyella sp. AtDHG13]PXV55832.1 PAS/PAC sensor hybrid histidine kinase [Dyella sp. AtDHG13]SDK54802.1 PAS/PAC sensor hybrid histidine kinase [Dyella jiangningensis]
MPHPPAIRGYNRQYAIYLLSPRGRVLACNMEGVMFGSPGDEELIGRDFLSLYAPDASHRHALVRALRDAAQSRKSVLTDVDLRRREGRHFRATITVEPLQSFEDRVHGLVVIVCDRSGARDAQERLRQSERRFRLFVNAVADHLICMLDKQGMILDWNLGAQRMTLFHPDDIEGQHYDIFFPEHDRQRNQPARLLERAARAGRVEYETELLRGDGSQFPACLTLEAVQDSQGDVLGFACIVRDVTKQHRLEQRLREAHEQIAHAQKVEAIGQLTGGIAHDFNNALQGIISSLEIASVYLERNVPEKSEQYLSVALEAAKRAGGLTQRLLGMARRQGGHHHTPVGTLLESLKDVLTRVLGDGISLQLDIEPDLPPIACDSGQLESAVLNLAINARDAMKGKGTLILKSCRCPADDGPTAAPAMVEISVIDNGHGMDEETVRRACEPFFTTKAQGQGTGLGLAMVSGFTAQHGGSMEIKSIVGRGTRVSLYFPSAVTEPSTEQRAAQPTEQELEGLRVLIVENDDTVRRSMAGRLVQLGCQVFEAATGREALLTLAACPSWDLLISDIDLPELDGYDLCREARKRFPRLRVILMTGYVDSELIHRDYVDERTNVLIKPFDMGDLLTKVRMLLRHRSAAS